MQLGEGGGGGGGTLELQRKRETWLGGKAGMQPRQRCKTDTDSVGFKA